mmetsp:Transcript_21973/g.51107  ORF Transcript_21973/g.51107 Transcript_21973/m.51107 type:complete len:204 (-) Transcript_21973:271-882(-)
MPHLSLGNEASPNRRVHSPGPGVVGLAWRRHDVLVHNAGSVEVSVHRGVGAHVLLLHPFRSCLGLAQRVHPPGPGIIGLAGRRHDVLATDPGSVEVSAQRGVGVPLLPQGLLDQRLSQHPLRSHRLTLGQHAIAHHAHFIRRVLASSPSPDGGTMCCSTKCIALSQTPTGIQANIHTTYGAGPDTTIGSGTKADSHDAATHRQ